MILLIIILISVDYGYADDSIESGLSTVLLGEYESGEILYDYNIDHPVFVASITKLMTYLVCMDEIFQGKVSLDDTVVIGDNPPKEYGSIFNLKVGEKVKLKTLIDSILVVSANDSCVAIAEHIAGSEEEFVKMMNKKARELGLHNTVYINSNGLPEREGQNIMSSRDIFTLSRHIISKYPQILDTTKLLQLTIKSREYNRKNTNPLLKEIPDIDGLKTGYTDKAGYCLVSTLKVPTSETNEIPFRLIGIIMGASSEEVRKEKSIQLLSYGIKNYKKTKVLSKDAAVHNVKIYNAENIDVNLFPEKDLTLLTKKGTDIRKEIIIDKSLRAPIKMGEKVGKIVIHNGNTKEEIALIVKRNINKASFFKRIYRFLMTLINIFQ